MCTWPPTTSLGAPAARTLPPRTSYTVYFLHHVHPTPCTSYTVYILHRRPHAAAASPPPLRAQNTPSCSACRCTSLPGRPAAAPRCLAARPPHLCALLLSSGVPSHRPMDGLHGCAPLPLLLSLLLSLPLASLLLPPRSFCRLCALCAASLSFDPLPSARTRLRSTACSCLANLCVWPARMTTRRLPWSSSTR